MKTIEEARAWLERVVNEKLTCTDFVIQGEEKLSDTSFAFNVNYNWQLNAWKKNVSRRVVVLWIEDNSCFVSPDMLIGGMQ